MKSYIPIIKVLACTLVLGTSLHASPEEVFLEKWVVSKNRPTILAELVPGTRNYYFFHALHYQHQGQQKQFTSMMKKWNEAIETRGISSRQLHTTMSARAAVLDYENRPEECIKTLSFMLKIKNDHPRPLAATEKSIPSQLPEKLISPQAFRKHKQLIETDYKNLETFNLYPELAQAAEFSRAKRLWFLKKIKLSDHPAFQEMVLAELQHAAKPALNKIPGHGKLTTEQLIWLESKHPQLISDHSYIKARLSKMILTKPEQALFFPDRKFKELQKAWAFCRNLSKVHTQTKTQILYHLLEAHRQRGEFPENLFLEYLELSRPHPAQLKIKQGRLSQRIGRKLQSQNYLGLTTPSNDQKLQIDYLENILGKKDDASAYSKYIKQTTLNPLHARARLLAGANETKWSKFLSPENFRSLRDLTEVSFLPNNKNQWTSKEEVSLQLGLKNTSKLTVRIFEIDSLAHLRAHGQSPTVTMKLDGLVPHQELTHQFDQHPMVRHSFSLKLPQLKGRGTWIVECISKGISCRSLVRKGALHAHSEYVADGQLVSVIDETHQPITATLFIGEKAFTTNALGQVKIPHSHAIGSQATNIIYAGNPDHPTSTGLATLTNVKQTSPDYQLKLNLFTEAEQIRAGGKASLLLRASLLNHDSPVPLSTLKNMRLHVSAMLAGARHTDIADVAIKLDDKGMYLLETRIPEDLRSLNAHLTADIPNKNKEPLQLSAKDSISVNGTSDGLYMGQAYLNHTTKGWSIDLLGKTGEPLIGHIVKVTFGRHGYDSLIDVTLKSDQKGQIQLGHLHGIYGLEVFDTPSLKGVSVDLVTQYSYLYDKQIDCLEGEEIRLPLELPKLVKEARQQFSLFLVGSSSENLIRSASQHLSTENGELVIKNLPAGEYILKSVFSNATKIRVFPKASTRQAGKWLHITGETLPHYNPKALHFSNTLTDNGNLRATLNGADESTEVVAIGTRFYHAYDHSSAMPSPPSPSLRNWHHGYEGNAYLNGNKLSDEYRYILERRSGKTYPGNMLPRPGLLIRPRSLSTAEAGSAHGRDSKSGVVQELLRRPHESKKKHSPPPAPPGSENPCFDFLSRASIVRVSIKLNAKGEFTLPLKDFAHCQSISLVAQSGNRETFQIVPLDPVPLKHKDLRLDRHLDPQKHYIGTRSGAALKAGATAKIENVLDADWRAYTSLAHVFDYFRAQGSGPTVGDFIHITRWQSLNDKQRRGAANLLASHEFHLFAYIRDRKWFDTNIKPLLANKRHRDFMDDFLLGNDLKPYLRTWKFSRLNAAEKALLARALPEHQAAIVADLRHSVSQAPVLPQLEARSFASVLQNNTMAARDRLGFSARDIAMLEHAERRVANIMFISEWLAQTIIPQVQFDNITLTDAINEINALAKQHSTIDPIPISLSAQFPREVMNAKVKQLHLRRVPLGELLEYVCRATSCRFEIQSGRIAITPLNSLNGSHLLTHSFHVPPGFIAKLDNTKSNGLKRRTSITHLLKQQGVAFPDGTFASYNPATSVIVVKNTAKNIELMNQLTQLLRSANQPASRPQEHADPFASSGEDDDGGDDPFGGGALENLDDDEGGDDAFAPEDEAPEAEQHNTQIYEESRYYKSNGTRSGSSITANRFWLDLAQHDGKSAFLSPFFRDCTQSPNSMLMALAVLELPFEGKKPDARIENFTLNIKATTPMLLFFRNTRETDQLEKNSSLLVSQRYFRMNDRHRTDKDGNKNENPVGEKFLTGVPYTSSFIITNPTDLERKTQVLLQIPRGSIPLGTQPATDAREVSIKPHSSKRVEYHFYFPHHGTFPHFPTHVIENNRVQTFAKAQTLKVLAKPDQPDTRTWRALATFGSNAEVLDRLAASNPRQLDLNLILWRCKDKHFYLKASAILQKALYYHPQIFSYAFLHGNQSGVTTYLENAERCSYLFGKHIASPLINYDTQQRGHWQHLEFSPLTNERSHIFQDDPYSRHPKLREHYTELLNYIAWKPAPTQDDILLLTYYLFLQDRIHEALTQFKMLDREKLSSPMQYDYLHCYALFYQEKPQQAAAIAERWKNSPAALWRNRFETVILQSKRVSQQAAPNNKAASKQPIPSMAMHSDPQGILLEYSHIKTATFRFYSVDLEVLFSETPFLRQKQSQMLPTVKPNAEVSIALPEGKKQHRIPLPNNLGKGSQLVIAQAGDIRRIITLNSTTLRATKKLSNHTLYVAHAKTGQPVSRCYVKVYVETTNGDVKFLKDGYTDLRGVFPYRSHNLIRPQDIKHTAIFISHPEHGATVLK